jgi:hypothetical protein
VDADVHGKGALMREPLGAGGTLERLLVSVRTHVCCPVLFKRVKNLFNPTKFKIIYLNGNVSTLLCQYKKTDVHENSESKVYVITKTRRIERALVISRHFVPFVSSQ